MIAGEQIILRALEREDLDRCYRFHFNDPTKLNGALPDE